MAILMTAANGAVVDVSAALDSPSVLTVLRVQTSPLHKRLDERSLLTPLMHPQCRLTDYISATQALWSAYQEVDFCLQDGAQFAPPVLPGYQPRSPLLASDLDYLEAPLGSAMASELPPIQCRAAYLGVRYVVEGAVLGARLIRRALGESAIAAAMPLEACFWTRVQSAQSAWPVLMRELDQSRDALVSRQAAESACIVFTRFIQHLKVERA